MITSYTLKLGRLEIFDDYLKAIIKEGVTISYEFQDILVEISNKHFKNKAFVYVSHRIHSYAVNPTIYLETSKIKNLIGFAVVSDDPRQKTQSQLEKVFFNKELKQFDDIASALDWKSKILQNHYA